MKVPRLLKRERELAVTEAVKSICEDICGTTNEDENKKRAETIMVLMESLN